MINSLPYSPKYYLYRFVGLAMCIQNSLHAKPYTLQDQTDKVFTVTETEFLAATQNAQSLLVGNRALLSELRRIKRISNLQEIMIERLTQENTQLRRALYKLNQSNSPSTAFNQTVPTLSNVQVARGTARTMSVNVSTSLSSFNDLSALSDVHLGLNNFQVKALKEIELSPSFISTLPLDSNDLEFSSAQSHLHPTAPLDELFLPPRVDLTTAVTRSIFTEIPLNQEETLGPVLQNAFEPVMIRDPALILSNAEGALEPIEGIPLAHLIESAQEIENLTPPALSITIIQPETITQSEQVFEAELPPLPSLEIAQATVEPAIVTLSPVTISESALSPVEENQLEAVPTTPEFRTESIADENTGEISSQIPETAINIGLEDAVRQSEAENQQSYTIVEAIRSELAAIPQFIGQLIGIPAAPIDDNPGLDVEEPTMAIPSSPLNLHANIAAARQPDDEFLNISPRASEPMISIAPVIHPQPHFSQSVLNIETRSSLRIENESLRNKVADLENELQEMRVLLTSPNDVSNTLVTQEPYEDEFEASLRNINLGKLDEDHLEELEQKISILTLEKGTLLENNEMLSLAFEQVKRENKVLNTRNENLSQAYKKLKQQKDGASEMSAEKSTKRPKKLFVSISREDSNPELVNLKEINEELEKETQKFVKKTSPSLRGKITELNSIILDFKEKIKAQNIEIEALSTKNHNLEKEAENLRRNNHSLNKKHQKLIHSSKQNDKDFKDIRDLFLWFNDKNLPQPKLLQLTSEEMQDFIHKILSKTNKHIQSNDESEEKIVN